VKRWWQLGSLVPAIMIVAALANFGLSFKSLDWLAFRTWEVARMVEHPSGIGPFEPATIIRKEHAYGDLANLGNMKDMREYRSEEFSVDQFGFRNVRSDQLSNPVGFVVGDSFTVGAAVRDSETLPAQLTKDAHGYFYNAGGGVEGGLDSLSEAQTISSMLHLSSGILVFQLLERSARETPYELLQLAEDNRTRAAIEPQSIQERIERATLATAVNRFVSNDSPAVILSRKLIKGAENDFWLPNPYRDAVVRRRLNNGDEILFYDGDLSPARSTKKLSPAWRAYLTAISGRLAKENITLIVMLVPNKFTVYGPLTDTVSRDSGGEEFLSGFEKELRTAGIPVLNLTPLFRTSAAQGLSRHEYLYWRDDTHWNARGIKLAADALWSEIQKGRAQNGNIDPSVAAELSHGGIHRTGTLIKHNSARYRR
jgi:hypothetical protein